jgi:AraC-like DNA-binding protein
VARKVGYSSAFALSAAFKRVRGVTPQQYRAGAAAREMELAGAAV